MPNASQELVGRGLLFGDMIAVRIMISSRFGVWQKIRGEKKWQRRMDKGQGD